MGAARHVLIRKRRRSEHVVHQRAYRHVDSVCIPTVEKKQIEGRHGDQCNRVLSHSLPHWNETQTKCRQAGTSNGPNALTTALKGVGRPMIEPDASEAIGGSSVAFLFLPGASCGPVQSTKISWTSACA